MYQLIPNHFAGLYKQKDNGNKINIRIQPTKNFIRFDESLLYPKELSPTIMS